MSMKSSPWWLKVDFAGKHGTAWGAFNLGLTVVTLTTLGRVFADAPWYYGSAIAGGGFILTLAVAAFRKNHVPIATVIYQLGCWAGSGAWAAWMLQRPAWGFRGWAEGVIILAAATIVAGLLLALGKEKPTDTPESVMAPVEVGGLTQGERNALGAIWVERIDRLSGNVPQPVSPGKQPKPWLTRVKIEVISTWKSGAGYTIEGVFTSGEWGLAQLQAICEKLAGEADLPYGCHIRAVAPGGEGRRAFHLMVNTKNMLLEPQPFPVNAGPWTINGGTPVAVEQTGDLYPIYFRQKNAAIYGAPGSGKTGSMKAATCSLALTADALLVGIDATGGQLINDAQNAYETRQAQHPVFACVARSYKEGEKLARALVRINHARKSPAYSYLKRRENATLLPIGAVVLRSDLPEKAREMFPAPGDDKRIVPQVMCLSDETKQFLSAKGTEVTLRHWLTTGMAEARDGGVRYMFGPLGTSEANIMQSVQNLVHTNAAMLLATDAEYAGVFGHHSGIKAESFPDKPDGSGKVPGIGFVAADPGGPRKQIRFFGEITPTVMDQVAIRASEIGALPELDYVSELAANGFLPDGSPWPCGKGTEMEESDRWFWRDRWANNPTPEKEDDTPAGHVPTSSPAPRSATAIMEELRAKTAEVEKAIDQRAGELMNEQPEEVVDEAELARIVDEWIAVAADAAPAEDEPWRDRVLRAIRDKGQDGLQMKDILPIAGVHKSEVYKFIRPLVQAGKLWQPKPGFYAFPADDLT